MGGYTTTIQQEANNREVVNEDAFGARKQVVSTMTNSQFGALNDGHYNTVTHSLSPQHRSMQGPFTKYPGRNAALNKHKLEGYLNPHTTKRLEDVEKRSYQTI